MQGKSWTTQITCGKKNCTRKLGRTLQLQGSATWSNKAWIFVHVSCFIEMSQSSRCATSKVCLHKNQLWTDACFCHKHLQTCGGHVGAPVSAWSCISFWSFWGDKSRSAPSTYGQLCSTAEGEGRLVDVVSPLLLGQIWNSKCREIHYALFYYEFCEGLVFELLILATWQVAQCPKRPNPGPLHMRFMRVMSGIDDRC